MEILSAKNDRLRSERNEALKKVNIAMGGGDFDFDKSEVMPVNKAWGSIERAMTISTFEDDNVSKASHESEYTV
jgi:hypothetical protein